MGEPRFERRYILILYRCREGSGGTVIDTRFIEYEFPPEAPFEDVWQYAEEAVDRRNFCGFNITKEGRML